MSKNLDVTVIGAGAAGLSASISLARAGFSVTIVEARDRIGGRMFTLPDPLYSTPIELGAEFIHGKPPEILNLLKRAKIRITEVDGDNWCVQDGRVVPCDFFSKVDTILDKMRGEKLDQSFLEFLQARFPISKSNPRMEDAKKRATDYVSGFNAADPARVGVHWLVEGMKADKKIEGYRAFRSPNGYSDLTRIFKQQLDLAGLTVQHNSIVKNIRWRRGQVQLTVQRENSITKLSSSRVLITAPLGVLQVPDDDGALRFTPALPAQKQNAIGNIAMGKIIRVTLRFRERFWDALPQGRRKSPKNMAGLSFLLSEDAWFPTWWTTAPDTPFLVGWAPFRHAERLSGQSDSFVVDQAIRALHRIFGIGVKELGGMLEQAYWHDWQNDPFSRGAYSYGIAGAQRAEHELARPVDDTLFFAGEATDITGHNGTVHGAIASGHRAAKEIIRSAGLKSETGTATGRKASEK